jgi:hypothetical protein
MNVVDFVVANTETGEIENSGSCQDDMVSAQAGPGQVAVPGTGRRSTHWVNEDSELVPYTEEQREAKSAFVLGCVWSNVTMSWEPLDGFDPLQIARENKWKQIKRARQAAIDAPLDTPYGVFDSDEKARMNITNSAQLMQTMANALQPGGAVPTIDYTLYDNSEAELTAGQMVEVGLLLGQKVQQAFATGRALRIQIDEATTLAEVASVVWPV